MIDALIALALVGVPISAQEQVVADPPGIEVKVREIVPEGHYVHGSWHGFTIFQEGDLRVVRPLHVIDIEGNVLQTIEGWRLLGSSGPHPRLYKEGHWGLGTIMPDGTMRIGVGVPIQGGGEFVVLTDRRQLTHPETAERFSWGSGQWSKSQNAGFHLAGSFWSNAGDHPELYVLEGESLTKVTMPEYYHLAEETTFSVIHADSERIIGTQYFGMAEFHFRGSTSIWRDGKLESLAKPAEYIMNIDGQRTAVTDWWAELMAPDGRLIGYTACTDADSATQSVYFVTVWDGDQVEVLPIPDEIINSSKAAAASSSNELGSHLPNPRLAARQAMSAYRGSLSADSSGNIGLAPYWSIGEPAAFLWDGDGWHNLTKNIAVGPGPYHLHLLPEGGKAFLYSRRSGSTVSHGPVWALEY